VTSARVPDASATAATAILGDFTQVMLGIWSELDILVNPFAEVPYRRGGVLVRAMSTVDVAVRHPQAFAYADDIVIVPVLDDLPALEAEDVHARPVGVARDGRAVCYRAFGTASAIRASSTGKRISVRRCSRTIARVPLLAP
jgi:Phage capsid family